MDIKVIRALGENFPNNDFILESELVGNKGITKIRIGDRLICTYSCFLNYLEGNTLFQEESERVLLNEILTTVGKSLTTAST